MACHRPSPALYLLAGVASFVVGSAVSTCSTAGCTPQEWAVAAPLAEGAFDALCPLEGLANPLVAASCPGQDALVAGAISAAEKGEVPPPGTSTDIITTDAGQAHAFVYALGDGGRRKLIGHGPCNPRAHRDAGSDGSASGPKSSPVTVVALPQAPAALPVVDAGRDGGS